MAGGQAAGRASVLVMAFVLLSRVLGVVRDMVISHRFGQDLITDVYTAAFRIPDILQYLVAGGALATVFVPVFTQYWTQEKREDGCGHRRNEGDDGEEVFHISARPPRASSR